MALRADPESLAPDRVIVFEVAGNLGGFQAAVVKIPGLEFLGESDTDFAADANFAVIDTRKATKGQDRTDKPVPGRFYLTMPDTAAFAQLLSLWEQWERDGTVSYGLAPFAHLFQQLHAVRSWGPLDRIDEDTIAFWREETQHHPDRAVRVEVELWFRGTPARRQRAAGDFRRLTTELGGTVVHEAEIAEIAYQGFLVDVPAAEIEKLIGREAVALAIADEMAKWLWLDRRSQMSRKKRPEGTTITQAKIGKRIQWARERVEPNRAAFARLLDLDRSTLDKIEKGTRPPSIFNVLSIAHRLRVPTDYILRGSLRGVDGELAALIVRDHPEALENSRTAMDSDTSETPTIPKRA